MRSLSGSMSTTAISGRPSLLKSAASAPSRSGSYARGLRDRLREGAVAVVEIKKSVFREIVGDVDVGTAIEIDVARDDAEAKSLHAAVDMGGGADVDK